MGHGEHPAVVDLIVAGELTINLISGSAITTSVGTATLDHEIGDDTVKNQPVVESFIGQVDEVLDGIGRILLKELYFHHAFLGVYFCNLHEVLKLDGQGTPQITQMPQIARIRIDKRWTRM